MGLDVDAVAMLVIQSDEPAGHAAAECELIASLCAENHATEVFSTDDPDEGEAFVVARRNAIPAVERTGTLLLEDVGVPLPQLGALVDGIAKIAADREITIAVVAHAGDGNTHPLLVFDPADEAMAERARTAYGEVMDLAMGLGGTITGEHGVGRLKRPWLVDYLGPDALALNHRIKQALDPQGILNPGAMFEHPAG
jgi:glycolate oxidase